MHPRWAANPGSADLIGGVKFVVHEPRDDAGLAHRLIPQEHQLVLGQGLHAEARHDKLEMQPRAFEAAVGAAARFPRSRPPAAAPARCVASVHRFRAPPALVSPPWPLAARVRDPSVLRCVVKGRALS